MKNWKNGRSFLIGHFREMVGNWPVAGCYFALWYFFSGLLTPNGESSSFG